MANDRRRSFPAPIQMLYGVIAAACAAEMHYKQTLKHSDHPEQKYIYRNMNEVKYTAT